MLMPTIGPEVRTMAVSTTPPQVGSLSSAARMLVVAARAHVRLDGLDAGAVTRTRADDVDVEAYIPSG